MNFTIEQVIELAADDSSVQAGKKLAAAKHWRELGQSPAALWGLCQGSAVYQVKIDLSSLGYHCSCPSRKFPCKHSLALLMLGATAGDSIARGEPPQWVGDWLARRQEKAVKKAEKQADAAAAPVDEKAQARRAEKRTTQVRDGLDRLDLWLRDQVRQGLVGLETKPPAFWDEQAKRLVDAQAPGLASRVARLATIPGAGRDWPERLLGEFGRIKLLLHAFGRLEQLEAPLQSDVRQMIGWNVGQDEIERTGERVEDAWVVVGQWTDDEDRVRAQRSWLVGRESRRMALVLQFSAAAQPFAESILPGSEQRSTLAFYPGAARQRAKIIQRSGEVAQLSERPPGSATIDEFLETISEDVARQPWLSTFGAVLHDVTLAPGDEGWFVLDRVGHALPLVRREFWKALALSGGHPCDLTGEWDGHALRPLSMIVEGALRTL
jgi:hypothetical protein